MSCFVNTVPRAYFFNRGTGIACDSTNLEVKRVACNARAETFTEVVASVASMVAMPLSPSLYNPHHLYQLSD